ncbi:AAA family ATPase [Magnetococcales bacterium HHB-1]
MINTLEIKNFKLFDHLEVPELYQITLIGGRNNIGKSALLEAIQCIFQPQNPSLLIRRFQNRGFPSTKLPSTDPSYLLGRIFLDYDVTQTILIKWTGQSAQKEPHTEETSIKYIDTLPPIPPLSKTSALDDDQRMQLQIENYLLKTGQLTDAIPTPHLHAKKRKNNQEKTVSEHFFYIKPGSANTIQITSRTGSAPREHKEKNNHNLGLQFIRTSPRSYGQKDIEHFSKLERTSKTDILCKYLRIVDPRIKDLSLIAIDDFPVIHANIGLSEKIPLLQLGEGINRLTSILLTMLQAENTIILIDEIENGLHHSTMQETWQVLAQVAYERNCQIIATTHSYECLQNFHSGLNHIQKAENFSINSGYIRLDAEEQNHITTQTYDIETLEAALEEFWEVR